jgi:hypothetical protein
MAVDSCSSDPLTLIGLGDELDALERPAAVAVVGLAAGVFDHAVEGDEGGADQSAHRHSFAVWVQCLVRRPLAAF